jgi:2',3'-cyclic-nucleotide 2'-phosphodiesterase
MNILFLGDIVGRAGRTAVRDLLPTLKAKYHPEYVIANGENSAAGFGITRSVYDELIYDYDINTLTSGNHVWDKKEIFKDFPTMEKLLRPANYPECMHGKGYRIDTVQGTGICVVSLLGRVFVHSGIDCPFRTMDKILAEVKDKAKIIIVDFHAETTSEKRALGFYLDGRVSAVIGTHTHVQTADEQILPNGTAYITDAGMVGPRDSVLGMQTQTAINRFLYGINERFEVVESGTVDLCGCLVTIDETTGKATEIKRIQLVKD